MIAKASGLFKILQVNSYKRVFHKTAQVFWNIPKDIEFDQNYLCDPHNIQSIQDNILNRKGVGDIRLVNDLHSKLMSLPDTDPSYDDIKKQFIRECLKIPNRTHPDIATYGNDPKVIKYIGEKNTDSNQKEFFEITKRFNLVRTEQLGSLCGSKSYYLLGEMAELEQALVRYFVGNLLKRNYQLISVPDILPRAVVESCGMNTRGERTQIYTLDPKIHEPNLCLSGTSEIALAGYLANQTLDINDIPLKLCAVSRCYRAETSSLSEERGIFRVHEFTKVEMFIVSLPDDSERILDEIRTLQEDLFATLGIHFQVLDMPPHDLGAQAYRKYDLEAWMPGRNMYGEISSCSNCTDYQSRRLNIKYRNSNGVCEYVHTLNGTACAVPRLLIALTETHQQKYDISIPQTLQKYMHDKTLIGRQKKIPALRLIKNKKIV